MAVTITSRENPAVKHVARLQKDAGYRSRCGEFAAEGEVLLLEALRSGVAVQKVFYRADKGLTEPVVRALPDDICLIETDERCIRYMSSVETAQGVVFCAKMAKNAPSIPEDGGILALENVRDPGNVGTILRTADAFGAACVVLCGSCADPYNPKTLRSSMGALFRLNMFHLEKQQLAELLKAQHRFLYAAALCADALDIRKVPHLSRAAVVIGNEAFGVSEELLALSHGKVKIPMPGRAESLNAAVAAAVVLWEMQRER